MEADVEGIDLTFELTKSDDGLILVLECRSSETLTTDQYASALAAFIDQLSGYADNGILN